ncbi:MAG: tRNA (N(6)-L-threonylcarbamoyladenosine(37)-C(2))-methylthiotransferase MtaB [Bacteroidota bacterium]|nr:tRNA (N(6)-L-threonylcarbamoyladenosine(37)-C(2))-methylthiotransferase MtaB [Bacteroidota bacterium]
MKKKIAFKTLGCRLNQYETDSLISQFGKEGYDVVGFNDEADVYVVNTCTVTNQSDHKSRNIIKQATRKGKEPVVVVTGCMANNKKVSLLRQDKVSYVVENRQKGSIFSIIDKHFDGEITLPDNYESDPFNFEIGDRSLHVRGLVKIQDGCNNFCTFCIIPFVRGQAISRPVNDVLENVRQLVKSGYKEIVLTGVNIGRYEFGSVNFEDLVEKILELEGDFRIRISSIEPEGFGDKLFGLMNHPKLVPHMHICLQSGSEKILHNMRRMYTASEFSLMVDKLKKQRPDINLTTDMIVGFPGETEEDHRQSLAMVEKIGFSHVHTFKYSERDGTRAVRMEGKVPGPVMSQRSEDIRQLSERLKREYRSGFIGKTQSVIIEKAYNGIATGHSEHFIPVKIEDKSIKRGQQVEVEIISIEDGEDPCLIGIV